MLSSLSVEARSQISVLSSFSAEARNGLGFGFGWKRRRGGWLVKRSQHETGLGFGLRLETPAWWWWLGVAISAWWWLGLADLGVAVPWACRSCGSPPRFADLGLGLPSPLFRCEVYHNFFLFSFIQLKIMWIWVCLWCVCETHGVCDVSVNLGFSFLLFDFQWM